MFYRNLSKVEDNILKLKSVLLIGHLLEISLTKFYQEAIFLYCHKRVLGLRYFKFFFMETNVISQEILLMHNSRFFSKELNERETPTDGKRLSQEEQIAEACWNGLIRETLPEISTSLSLIEVEEASAFLCLEFGENGQRIEKAFSLNPYLFYDALLLWN